MPADDMTFATYSSSPIFSKLIDIREFTLVANVPPLFTWSDDKLSRKVADRIFEQLREVVRAARFYFDHELKASVDADGVAVTYADDRYDFRVACSGSNIAIVRRGSSLSNFHAWYTALMPSAQGIVTNVANILSQESGRKLDVIRASYRFRFLVYDIQAENGDRKVRNSEIMRKLLNGFPDEKGKMTTDPAVLQTVSRADVSVGRWIGPEHRRRLVRFSVEAPANMEWSSLWFEFTYGSESYTSPDTGVRMEIGAEDVLAEYESAYIDFLRESAINGFLQSLMTGYRFRTTSSEIP